jgi:hypothetical protein
MPVNSSVSNALTRRAMVMAKLESSYGQDANPTGALNAILVNQGVTVTPKAANKEERKIIAPTMSSMGQVVSGFSYDLKLPCELRGGGLSAGAPLPPDYDPLLQACGMQQYAVVRLALSAPGTFQPGDAVTGGTSLATGTLEYLENGSLLIVKATSGAFQANETLTGSPSGATGTVSAVTKCLQYRPVTLTPSAQPAVTIHFHMDGILHTLLGGRGDWSIDAKNGKFPTIEFTFSGLFTVPTDAALPAGTLTSLRQQAFLSAQAQIGAYIPVMTALQLKLGNKVEMRGDVNSATGIVEALITDRTGSGSLDPEVDAVGAFNPWAAWQAGSFSKLRAVAGSQAGNTVAINVAAAQYTDVKYTDRVGLKAYDLPFEPTIDRAGDDEIRLIYS